MKETDKILREIHKKVYHVTGARGLFSKLKGTGLKCDNKGRIYYNESEYFLNGNNKIHCSAFHACAFWLSPKHLAYFRRFGLLPFVFTLEINAKGFSGSTYKDNTYIGVRGNLATDKRKSNIFGSVEQYCIPSQYIRLKAVTFVLPMFNLYKVIWRRR